MNRDLINNKDSTVIKLGTCTVNILCFLVSNYYTYKVFIVECNLSTKLQKDSFSGIIYINYFSLF